jgi:hypothetical protein
MKSSRPSRSNIVEWLFATLLIYFVIRLVVFFFREGYLPQPFFNDSNDTFMDWYNTAYWGYTEVAYSYWGSIYPPLSFLFLKVFSVSSCYQGAPLSARDCDPVGAWVTTAFALVNIYIAYVVFRKSSRDTALPRALALGIGTPALFGWERGNLVVPCLTVFMLGYGNIVRSAWIRWLCVGVTINLKPYLAVALIGRFLRGNWRWVEGCAVVTILIYAVSFIIYGMGNPLEIVSDILGFSQPPVIFNIRNVEYATSFRSVLDLLKTPLPLMKFVGSRPLELVESIVPLVMNLGALGVVACFAGALARPGVLTSTRLAAMSMALLFTMTPAPGCYAEVFLLFFVLFEKWRGVCQVVVLIAAYLLCVPWDYHVVDLNRELIYSYLGHHVVEFNVGLTADAVLRPILLLVIEYGLVAASVIELGRAILRPGDKSGSVAARPAFGVG